MFGVRWKVVKGVGRGDWQSKLLAIAQATIVTVALIGLVAMLTLHPLALIALAATQILIVGGVVLFAIVAIFAQRTMVLERFGPGEVIFREGEPGRHVYVVKSGTVDVLKRLPDGSDSVIATMGPGDHFGEIALLKKAPRTATVRTASAVEIFKMSPSSFVALYTNLPGVRDHFNRVMEARLQRPDVQRP